ncbi:TPA: energy transducer TonB [Neisseria weaveri]
MKNERILNSSVFALIALLHVGLMSLLWRAYTPEQAPVEHIEFVDLAGDFGGGDGREEGAQAAAPEPVKPKVAPKPKAEAPKPVLKPVITKDDKADIRQKKEEPKPKPKPEPKPESKPEPQKEAKTETASDKTPKNVSPEGKGSGEGTAAEGKGNGTKGKGDGRGTGEGTGSGSKTGSGHGDGGGGSGPGSSSGNAVKATGSIPRPPYPPLSLENEEEGTVVLKVMVAPDGKVTNVRVAKSSGFKRLDSAAQKAARNGRFQARVWTEFTVPVEFKID